MGSGFFLLFMSKVNLRKQKNKSGSYSIFLDYRLNGKRHREFLNFSISIEKQDKHYNKTKLRLAEEIRKKREEEIIRISYNFLRHDSDSLILIEYLDNFRKRKSKSLFKSYNSLMVKIKEFDGSILLKKVNEDWLERFEDFLSIKLNSNTTIKYLEYLKSSLNEAVRKKLIIETPFKYYRLSSKRKNPFKVYLTIDEIKKLIRTPSLNEQIKLAFLFSCNTGLRLSDIRKLAWEHIKNNRLYIFQDKTDELAYIPLNNNAILILRDMKNKYKNEETIFKLPVQTNISKHLKLLAKEAKIDKHITFHNARHTFATSLIEAGEDIYTVSKLIGHTDIKNTQVYAKVVDLKLEKAVRSLPSIELN